MILIKKIFKKISKNRLLFFAVGDILLISLAVYLAFLLKFEGKRKGSTLL